ncbi:MAG: glycosyltransferase family 2 protein [Candidatus Brocadiia bacterium]
MSAVEASEQQAVAGSTACPDVSIVVPVYNEADNVGPLCGEVREAMSEAGISYELLLVDDGSTDGTLEAALRAIEDDRRARVIELRRNFGKSAALNAGFDRARGELIVTMDGDLQNDPRDIPRLLEKMEEGPGYDVVSGWRQDRKENFVRRFPSRLANALISAGTGVQLHDYGCCLKAYRKSVLQDISLYGEMHRFVPALVRWVGGRVAEVPVSDRARHAGQSKFAGLGRTFEVLLDLATVKFMMHYLAKPLYFFGRIGSLLFAAAFAVLAVVIIQKLGYGKNMTGNPLLYLSVTFLIISVQVLLMGLMMEILTRTYHESQGRQVYAVRTVHEGGEDRERE